MGRQNHGGSAAGIDGDVIIYHAGSNAGASFTAALTLHGRSVNNVFKKGKQVAVRRPSCPKGCKPSFVFPRSLFNITITGTAVDVPCSKVANKLILNSSVWMEKVGKRYMVKSAQVTTLSASVYSHWIRMGHFLYILPMVDHCYAETLGKKTREEPACIRKTERTGRRGGD